MREIVILLLVFLALGATVLGETIQLKLHVMEKEKIIIYESDNVKNLLIAKYLFIPLSIMLFIVLAKDTSLQQSL